MYQFVPSIKKTSLLIGPIDTQLRSGKYFVLIGCVSEERCLKIVDNARAWVYYEGGSKSSRRSAAKFVIVFGNLRSLCIL